MTSPDVPNPKPRKPRSFARRWIPRFIVAFITLLIIIIVVTQLVLRSNLPRQIVLAQVQNTLGLRVTAASLTTGWGGRTTLRDVQVSLPLSDRAFLSLPEMRVEHTNLPMLLLTQSLDIHSIELDRPVVSVTQDQAGRWNLQDVIEIMAKLGGKDQGQQHQKSSPLVLPAVTLRDGTINITDNTNRHATLAPLNVTGTPLNSLVWKYDAHLDSPNGRQASFTGRVVPSDNFTHEVLFDLSHLAPLAKPWVADFDPQAVVKGSWKGALANGGVSGRLLLQSLQYQTFAARDGDFAIQTAGSSVTISPSALLFQAGNNLQTRLTITGGTIHADSASAKMEQLDVQALNGHVRLNGAFTYANLSGDLTASWDALRASGVLDTTGSVTASLRPEWPDRHTLSARLNTTGAAAGAPYSADVRMVATGKTWDTATATLSAPTLSYNWKTPVRLDGLAAHVTMHPGQIVLSDVAMGTSGAVSGAGDIKFDPAHPSAKQYDWRLNLIGQNIPIPPVAGSPLHDQTVAFNLNAWGDQDKITLDRAIAEVGDIVASTKGFYAFALPKPVNLNVFVSDTAKPPAASTAPPLVRGRLRGDAAVTGTVYPVNLQLAGQLHARDLVIGDRPLQNIDVKCTGTFDSEHAVFDTEELKLFDGQWKFHAQLPGRNQSPEATLQFHDLQLASVAELLNQSDIAGSVAGSLDADLNEPSLNGVVVAGTFTARDVHARQLQIDSADGTIALRRNELAIVPIHLTHGSGQADASLHVNILHPTLITATLNGKAWPVDAAAAHAAIDASTDRLLIDATAQTVTGRLNFDTAVDYQLRPVLTAKGAVELSGQTATLDAFDAAALGGTATGTASITLGKPLATRANFSWQNVNLNALSPYQERMREAGGSLSGQAVLGPDTDPRALAPMLLKIDTIGANTHLGPVQFAGAHLPISLDANRAVLDDGRIDVADGSISLFARASRHVDNTFSAQLGATLSELDVDQLINEVEMSSTTKPATTGRTAATRNEKSKFPGRLNGTIDIVGDPRNVKSLFGKASLHLHDSDLGNFGPFAALYNTMHLGGGPSTPSGTGDVEARYDNDNFVISSLHYFNRGTYAYGLVNVNNLHDYPDCKLQGTLAGTFRPLNNIKLPFFADADKIFSVLQSNLTSIVLDGTIRKPTYTPQSAAELGSAMRGFLLGDAQSK